MEEQTKAIDSTAQNADIAANDRVVSLSSLDALIPQRTRDSLARGDEHKDAERSRSVQGDECHFIEDKDNVFE